MLADVILTFLIHDMDTISSIKLEGLFFATPPMNFLVGFTIPAVTS